MTVPGEEFQFDLPYYTNKIGELSVLLELEERKRIILYGAYLELKNKYEPATQPQTELDMNDSVPVEEVLVVEENSETPKIVKRRKR